MLGRVQPAHFPAVFGGSGDLPLDADTVRERFTELADEVGRATGRRPDEAEAAAGFLEIAVLNMANAVKKITVQRGHDVTRYALTGFGGAGGQHVCAVADALGIDTVLVPPLAGVLSAYGIGLADATALREQSVEEPLGPACLDRVERLCAELADRTREALRADGVADRAITVRARLLLRYAGTDAALAVDLGTEDAMARAFTAAHRSRFGFTMDRPVVVETATVEATGDTGAAAADAPGTGAPPPPRRTPLRARPTPWTCTPKGGGGGPRSTAGPICAPPTPSPGPRSSPRTTPPPSSTPAGVPRPPPPAISSSPVPPPGPNAPPSAPGWTR